MTTYAEFFNAYVEALVWQTSDDDISSRHDSVTESDFGPDAWAEMRQDCQAFYDDNRATWLIGWTDEQAGIDFALTRNHHGAGFWDRYYASGPQHDAGKVLSGAAHVYGSQDVYLGDDGLLYVGG
jgi:hypothetical protein